MCRPSCCDKNGGQGTGIVAVAVIMVAALVAAKIGPIVANIIHIVGEVIRLIALTTGLVVALAAITWAVVVLTRWQLRRKELAANPTQVAVTRPWEHTGPTDRPECLACGGTGTVLRAINGGWYQPGECPECEPARRAG
jgi:hypothetical protein